LNPEENSPEKQENPFKNDPLQYIIWGILLVAFGLYSIYKLLTQPVEGSVIMVGMPYYIVLLFGILVTGIGIRREKERKENENKKE
jgi:choline-glycine betaine transporter